MKRGAALAIIILILLSIPLQLKIDSQREKLGLSLIPIPERVASSLWRFLGGMRSSLAALLWLKIDEIHHEYYGDLYREQELMPLYRFVTWLDPKWEDAYFVGSYLLYLYKKPKESLSFAEEGVKMNPHSAKLRYNLGEILFLLGKYKEAELHLKKAVLYSKDLNLKASSLALLVQAYRKLGKYEEAEKSWQEFLEVREKIPLEERDKKILQERHEHD
jgi:tetratricopeptide (TPR) repeat protein